MITYDKKNLPWFVVGCDFYPCMQQVVLYSKSTPALAYIERCMYKCYITASLYMSDLLYLKFNSINI